jgi:hypothetical protein
MTEDLRKLLEELETLADRADACGFNLLAISVGLIVRCAYQLRRTQWLRMLTIISTVLELCPERHK